MLYRLSVGILVVSVVYLICAWTAVILVDIHNFRGFQSVLVDQVNRRPLVWFLLFREGGPTERLQWFMLASACMACVVSWAGNRGYNQSASHAHLFMAFAILLLLLEDATNIRHLIGGRYLLGGVGGGHPARIIWEFLFYAFLGGLMVFSIVALRRHYCLGRRIKLILVSAYIIYAIAAVASASRNIRSWYGLVGEEIVDRVGVRDLPAWVASEQRSGANGGWLIDCLFEESLELIAATLLAVGLLLLSRKALQRGNPSPSAAKVDIH